MLNTTCDRLVHFQTKANQNVYLSFNYSQKCTVQILVQGFQLFYTLASCLIYKRVRPVSSVKQIPLKILWDIKIFITFSMRIFTCTFVGPRLLVFVFSTKLPRSSYLPSYLEVNSFFRTSSQILRYNGQNHFLAHPRVIFLLYDAQVYFKFYLVRT